ncbi:MAG TPA: ATP-binding protein [Pseudomonadales bacterium]
MSLRVRLSLIVSLLFAVGMVLGLSFLIGSARQRVAEEVGSAAMLTSQLLESVLADAGVEGIRDHTQLLERLGAIENARHLDISIGSEGSMPPPEPALASDAPGWFVWLVQAQPLRYAVPLGGGEDIVIRANPADEIDEVWRETRTFIFVLSFVLLVLNGLLYVTLGRWLAPVSAIVAQLDEAEQGDFSGRLPPASLPELKAIAEKLNELTATLRSSQEENDRLTQMALVIRENERRHLARELHDELGQSISAIKAMAFSIAQRLRGVDDMSAEGAARIGTISNEIGSQVRSMMSRLRPPVLDELGLIAALQSMIDEWNRVHRETFCSFRSSVRADGDFGALDADAQINLYRIVQEALTNAARHAQAERIDITLTASGTHYDLVITDDGRGYDPATIRAGMGLSGIRERSHALNGTLDLVSSPGAGVRIELRFTGA